MKKVLLMTAAIALFAVPAMAAISSTKHNLNSTSGNAIRATNQTQICVFCHTPHNATVNVPLWNRTNPVGAIATYNANNSPSINNTIPADLAQNSISRFCLSCHDGTANVGARVQKTPDGAITMTTESITGNANIGTDLSNDHPVGFTVVDNSDAKIKLLTVMETGGIRFFTSSNGSNQLECASCHDVHDAAGIAKFLRTTNAGSALCLTCHIK